MSDITAEWIWKKIKKKKIFARETELKANWNAKLTTVLIAWNSLRRLCGRKNITSIILQILKNNRIYFDKRIIGNNENSGERDKALERYTVIWSPV